MRRRVTFSADLQAVDAVASQHHDTVTALRLLFGPGRDYLPSDYAGFTRAELEAQLGARLAELERTSILNLMAALEAALRVDYLQRGQLRKKRNDGLTDDLRAVYAEHDQIGRRAGLGDILGPWRRHAPALSAELDAVARALKYRHWLAHGRYWVLKLGGPGHEFLAVYQTAKAVVDNLPLIGAGGDAA